MTHTPPRQRRPTFLQAIVITGAGILVAFFGCLGAIAGFSRNSNSLLGNVGMVGFAIGSLAFLIGVVLLGVVVVRSIVAKPASDTPAPVPPPPSGAPHPYVRPSAHAPLPPASRESDAPGPGEGE